MRGAYLHSPVRLHGVSFTFTAFSACTNIMKHIYFSFSGAEDKYEKMVKNMSVDCEDQMKTKVS
jgi:hypothetical protein